MAMAVATGKIVLMGSGELTATMVEVHKWLLAQLPPESKAVFIDTPAGFQSNVEQISERAVDYFQNNILHPLSVASFRSLEDSSGLEQQQALGLMRSANYILMGPGSPTYAVRQFQSTPVPNLLTGCIEQGGCLVAASAAALTAGRFTLPVYEIYKVGHELHWQPGLDILSHFGIHLVVIPHWNNAEGGNHDTRYCFMGEQRFQLLQSKLPEYLPFLGLDEHTACIIDLAKEQVEVRGIGRITYRTADGEICYNSGEHFALSVLQSGDISTQPTNTMNQNTSAVIPGEAPQPFWEHIHALDERFQKGISNRDGSVAAGVLLEVDHILWQAQHGQESPEAVVQARDMLRDMIVLLGNALTLSPAMNREQLEPLVEALLQLRQKLRQENHWEAADMLRDALKKMHIQIDDTAEKQRWRILS